MINLALLPWTKIVAGLAIATVVAGAFWKTYHSGRESGKAEVQTKWDAEKLALIRQSEINAQNVRASEDRIRADAQKDREVANAKIRKLTITNKRLVSSLQNRPERPAASANPVPATGSVGNNRTFCTGEQLYRQDGEFLAREAERADYLRIKLEQCQTRYHKLAAEIEAVNKKALSATAPEPATASP